jgi:hypothetical protein
MAEDVQNLARLFWSAAAEGARCFFRAPGDAALAPRGAGGKGFEAFESPCRAAFCLWPGFAENQAALPHAARQEAPQDVGLLLPPHSKQAPKHVKEDHEGFDL